MKEQTQSAYWILASAVKLLPSRGFCSMHLLLEAPTSEFEANDQQRNLEWLNSLGITVRTPKQAQAAANLLFFGQKSPMFPDTNAIDPELTPLLLLVLYLSRFENKVVELRKAVGFEDEANPFAVL